MSEKDILRKEAEKLMRAATTEPVTEVQGQDVYTYADAAALNQALLTRGIENSVEVGERETINGGLGYTSSRRRNVAINPASFFDNRFRVVEVPEQEEVKAAPGRKAKAAIAAHNKYEIVMDSRAIQEQSSGRVYAHNIQSYVVEPTEEGLKLEASIVTDTEFINEFKHRMSDKDIKSVKQAIDNISVEAAEPKVLGL